MHLFYSALNLRTDTSCERYFRYDTKSPVHSIESGRPLRSNHIIGFTLTYENDVLHLVQMLERGGIPLWNTIRTEKDPIVVVGGPAISGNPEPYRDFVDAFAIGEGDFTIHAIVEAVKSSNTREEAISRLATIPSIYVPAIEQKFIKRSIISNIDEAFHPTQQVVPMVPEGDKREPVFGKALLVEVTRGCKHSCKFCLIGHISRPGRTRSLENLKDIIREGIQKTPVRKIALIGSSVGDMDELEDLMGWMEKKDLEFSVPSLRADRITKNILELLAKVGQRTLTFAPETGSEELRRHLGKSLKDEHIEKAAALAPEAGMRAIKLYFIVGLPGETDDDVKSIGTMVRRISEISGLKVTVSANPFIPKAHTRFEREPQLSISEIRRRLKIVEKDLRRIPHTVIESLDPRLARIQAALSLGDHSLSKVIWRASQYGGLGGWRRGEKEAGIEFFSLANNRERLLGKLPWSFIR
ncbi:MAG: B12-binding domain-containing radical SAM protein [Candidatus Thorarchaeota archaeon]